MLKNKSNKILQKRNAQVSSPESIRSIKSLSQFRGVSSGYNYAEAFVLGRKRWMLYSGWMLQKKLGMAIFIDA